MILLDGAEWGTAAEVARRLGPDVTVAMVRNWSRRDGLTAVRSGRHVLYPLAHAAAIEAAKRRSTRGRPRQS